MGSRAHSAEQLLAYVGAVYGRVMAVKTLAKGKYNVVFDSIEQATAFTLALNSHTNMSAEYEVMKRGPGSGQATSAPVPAPAPVSAPIPAPIPAPPAPYSTQSSFDTSLTVREPTPPVKDRATAVKEELASLLKLVGPKDVVKLALEMDVTPGLPSASSSTGTTTGAQTPTSLPSLPAVPPASNVPSTSPGKVLMGTKVFINPAKFNPKQAWEDGEVPEHFDAAVDIRPPPADTIKDKLAAIEGLLASLRKETETPEPAKESPETNRKEALARARDSQCPNVDDAPRKRMKLSLAVDTQTPPAQNRRPPDSKDQVDLTRNERIIFPDQYTQVVGLTLDTRSSFLLMIRCSGRKGGAQGKVAEVCRPC